MNRDVRLVAGYVLTVASSGPVYEAAKRLSAKKAKPAKRAARQRREAKRETRTARVGVIREAVFERAKGQCEAYQSRDVQTWPWVTWRRCTGTPTVLDHWLGGVGRRRSEETIETCWALCASCDRERTRNRPSAAHWNESRRHHDVFWGYPHTPHYEARAAARTP